MVIQKDTPAQHPGGPGGRWAEVVARAASGDPGLTTVCLVRHGETDWNVAGRLQGREDVALNPRGREQARRSGLALRPAVSGLRWDLVVTSPLLRAAETAHIISELAEVPRVESDPDLVERDYGAGSGLTRAERAVRFPGGAFPDEESRASVQQRSLAALTRWVDHNRGARIVLVSHGGVISALLHSASGGAVSVIPGSLGNACLSVLHFDGRWRVLAHNVVDHLA